jgi:hypothetical protein
MAGQEATDGDGTKLLGRVEEGGEAPAVTTTGAMLGPVNGPVGRLALMD